MAWPRPRRASLATAGCEARGEAEGSLFHPGVTGKGQTGRVNVSEPPFDVSLCVSLADGLLQAGCRGWPLESGRRRPGIFCRPGEHRRPRDTGGTHPGRISCVWNVGTPMGSGRGNGTGQPTARKAQSPSGGRMTREANAGGRKATGNRDAHGRPSAGRPAQLAGYGRVPGPERVLTRVG